VNRDYYLELGRAGLRMPIGTDLVLHEQPDPAAVVRDGRALGRVVEETARRYRTPLALGHMDLTIEKAALLRPLGVSDAEAATFHFKTCPDEETVARIRTGLAGPLHPHLQAQVDAMRYIARETDLLPVGMTIGPFSLTTKLLSDPIAPIYLAGTGLTAEEDPEVRTVETLLELATLTVLRSVAAQIEAGAKALLVAEPAANKVYVSPRQMEAGSDIFDRYPIRANRRLTALLQQHGADLLFHCCGELTDDMVRAFATLRPVILSLGSSRKLWEDARLVPDDIVLYGNLPSKHFYSDALVSRQDVERMACELLDKMRATGHPFVLGTECDVLSVPGAEAVIRGKVDAFVCCQCQ
jgi:uroporphyrinogen-III decarboxylase